MATYVLVHGGSHGGWCYRKVAKLLRSAGHDVYTPTLTGLGERAHLLSPDVDLDTHVTDITALLFYEDVRDAILVGHSYGGMVITGAADRAADRVAHLVFLDAATPVHGESLADVASQIIHATRRRTSRIVGSVELVNFPGTETIPFYGVTDPDDRAWMAERLTPHPWKSFEQPLRLTNEEVLWEIPQTHIVCTSRPAPVHPERMEPARAVGRVWEIDTGHDLMITEPEAVAEMLLRISSSPGGTVSE